MESRAARGRPAYTLVDLSGLKPEVREELTIDASNGGGQFGLRIVEEVHNGPARSAIYGVYDHDKALWEEAKKEFGLTAETVDNNKVGAVEGTDPRTEAALRQAAEEQAMAEAERARSAGDAEIDAIVNGASVSDSSIDRTLAPDAAGNKAPGKNKHTR